MLPVNALSPSLALAVILACSLVACAPLPGGKDFPPTQSAAPPVLLPLDQLLAQAKVQTDGPARAAGVVDRAARLRARAGLMRGPVHDPATRARLAKAIAEGRA